MKKNFSRRLLIIFVSQIAFSSTLYAKSFFLRLMLRIFCCLPLNAVTPEKAPVQKATFQDSFVIDQFTSQSSIRQELQELSRPKKNF